MPLTVSRRCRNITPSLTLAIDARAKEMKAQGLPVIGLGAGEPDFDTPDFICDAAKEAIDKGLTRYTPAGGTLELRKAICEKLLRENHLGYEPADIVVSNGAKHTLFTIFQAILDPGDEVLIPTPCWVSYPEMVRMAGGVPVFVPTTEAEGFIPTAAQLAARVTPRTKALVITSPGNPCGGVWSREQLAGAAQLAVRHSFYVISDEIYEKLLYDNRTHVSIAELGADIKAQTFVVNGVSKAYAMTGWRIGYAAGPREVISAMVSFQSQATSNPNSIAQYAAAAALRGDQACVGRMTQEFQRRRNYMVERLNAIPGLGCLKPQGAFYIMLNIQGVLGRRFEGQVVENSMDFARLLLDRCQVAVVPGAAFEAEGYCRLSYAVSMESIAQGMDRIEQFVQRLRMAA